MRLHLYHMTLLQNYAVMNKENKRVKAIPNFRNSHFQNEAKCKTFAVSQRSCPCSPLSPSPPPPTRMLQDFSRLRPLSTLETRRGVGPKCVSQLFLGSFLGTRWSKRWSAIIGHFFSLSPVTVPNVFAKINWTQFLSCSTHLPL